VFFDFRFSSTTLGLMICCLVFPFLPFLHVPLFNGATVTAVETVQVFLLLTFAFFTWFYVRPLQLDTQQKYFWIWAVLWWVLLFGRSTSWGRDYFPEVPKVYFRALSVLFIAPVVFLLFTKALRSEIVRQFKQLKLAFWPLMLLVIGLFVSDGVEHHRPYAALFLHDASYQDFIEEMYEFPLIIGLFLVSFTVLKVNFPHRNLKKLDSVEAVVNSDVLHTHKG
jgi:hypothetical protein